MTELTESINEGTDCTATSFLLLARAGQCPQVSPAGNAGDDGEGIADDARGGCGVHVGGGQLCDERRGAGPMGMGPSLGGPIVPPVSLPIPASVVSAAVIRLPTRMGLGRRRRLS